MLLQVRVLRLGIGLDLTPVAVQHVLLGVDQLAGSCATAPWFTVYLAISDSSSLEGDYRAVIIVSCANPSQS